MHLFTYTIVMIDGAPAFRRSDGQISPMLLLVAAALVEGQAFHVPAVCVEAAEAFTEQLEAEHPGLVDSVGSSLLGLAAPVPPPSPARPPGPSTLPPSASPAPSFDPFRID